MRIITERELIKSTPSRWRETYQRNQYATDPEWFGNKNKVQERLDALDTDTCTAEDVDAIIGNSSWTRLACDECKEQVKSVVQVGEEPDCESSTAALCETCANAARRLFAGASA